MHIQSEPPILYFGTPVVVISTVNEDGSFNLAPMSSAFWLGWRCIIGLAASSKTTQNILRTRECLLNLPSVDQVAAVNLLAKTTGSDPVPAGKQQKGYRHVKGKFELAGFTPVPSLTVEAPRANECPVQLEAALAAVHPIGEDEPAQQGKIITFELRIQRVHLHPSILFNNDPNRIDPDKWKPLIMSFQQFYTLGEQVHASTLAQIPEALYKTADMGIVRDLPNINRIFPNS
ncbi:flavin reductase family protein [Pseudoflavitalea sp. G-6-1-2]|uniref:flavin reductase family protein n=1 Tax=Pseudoflavitalea sp. G-6-1-2 TaxID=2728841 RepID=UPI00146D9C4F|nr:flavin reductase family protein [Pseudoflavitalea sp. G-6-1-2]NML23496.1 flavin reductase family protein [Pseudoflavitalea sp. G-6-1-2]